MDRKLAEICQARFEERYPLDSRYRAEASAAPRGGAARHRLARPRGLLRPAPRDPRARARGRGGGARSRGWAAGTNPRALLPPGRGRGSSVSSIVCHLTGLSHVDPIANKLLLGRFLNEELTALPDIDLDFPRDIREVLIPRIHEIYGTERSALVAAFPTYRARGAIREIGKALGLAPGEIERVARGSEGWSTRDVDRDIDTALGEGRRTGRWAWLARLAAEAQGLPRHLSQHSGGMIVATRPLVDCVPLVPAAMEGRQLAPVGQGLLRGRGLPEDRPARPRDAERGRALRRAHRRAARGAHRPVADPVRRPGDLRVHPERRDDRRLSDRVARADGLAEAHAPEEPRGDHDPGRDRATGADRRRRGQPLHRAPPARCAPTRRFQVPYLHPSLEEPLRDTLGTIIFQDQVLEVAQAFAGFSPGQAEGLRRAMSRKRSAEAIEAHHRGFVEGAMRKHPDVREELAEKVFEMVSGFAGFGFPKAHGAAFGLLAYQSTWLRVHYGPEFLCSLLDEQPMGFYPPDALVHEAQRRGIEVFPPDVNASAAGCTVMNRSDPPAVRIGLGYVLGVRADEIAALVAAREAGGPVQIAGRSRLARRCRAAGAGAPRLVGRLRRARGRRSPGRAVAARRRRARRARARARGRAARARARPAGAAEAQGAAGVGGDGRRLRDDRADGVDAPDRAAARSAGRRAGGQHRCARAPAARRAGARRRAGRRAPEAGDREGHPVPALEDEHGTSTSSSRRRSTSATASRCAPSRCCSSRAGSSATRRRAVRSTCSRGASCGSRCPIASPPRSRTSRCWTSPSSLVRPSCRRPPRAPTTSARWRPPSRASPSGRRR